MSQWETILPVAFFGAGAAMAWVLTASLLAAARAAGRRGTVPTSAVVLMMVRSLLIAGLFVAAGLQGLWAGPRAGLFSLLAAIGGYLLTRRVLARSIRGQL
jgi:hypothetical protein